MIRHRASKYGAVRAAGMSGRSYASTAERDRADELRLMEQGGEINDLREQRIVTLADAVRYRPDFDYLERGRRVYEDVKGYETERVAGVCQLWRVWGPGPLRILKRRRRLRQFEIVRTILPGQRSVAAE